LIGNIENRIFSRLSKYSFVAVGSAASDWLTFTLLSFAGISPIIAQGIARIVGGLVSFYSNRHWSFATNETTSKVIQGRRFLLLYCLSYGLSLGLFFLMINTFEANIFLAKAMIDTVCFAFNFIVMWLYVFHQRTGFIHWFKSLTQQFR